MSDIAVGVLPAGWGLVCRVVVLVSVEHIAGGRLWWSVPRQPGGWVTPLLQMFGGAVHRVSVGGVAAYVQE